MFGFGETNTEAAAMPKGGTLLLLSHHDRSGARARASRQPWLHMRGQHDVTSKIVT